jgi:hypothetical protein
MNENLEGFNRLNFLQFLKFNLKIWIQLDLNSIEFGLETN